jgi:hypothetical protein
MSKPEGDRADTIGSAPKEKVQPERLEEMQSIGPLSGGRDESTKEEHA